MLEYNIPLESESSDISHRESSGVSGGPRLGSEFLEIGRGERSGSMKVKGRTFFVTMCPVIKHLTSKFYKQLFACL